MDENDRDNILSRGEKCHKMDRQALDLVRKLGKAVHMSLCGSPRRFLQYQPF